MVRRLQRLLAVGSVLAAVAAGTAPAAAQRAQAGAAPADSVQDAQRHFAKARELYQAGRYKEAILHLEQAHALDPGAKDLVLNLALVSERLARIDDALRHTRHYLQMDLEPAERTRAEASIRRLEGARQQVAPEPTPPPPTPVTATPTAPPLPAPPPPAASRGSAPPGVHGRVDALTVGAAAVAVAGFAVGSIFAIRAIDGRPTAGTVTQDPGSYAELERRTRVAHDQAVVADVGFAVGLIATLGTAILYFGRTRSALPAPRADLGLAGAAGRF